MRRNDEEIFPEHGRQLGQGRNLGALKAGQTVQKPIYDYVQTFTAGTTLTPNERFLLQRLEGLAKRLATLP